MTALPYVVISAPLVLLAGAFFYARLVSTPSQSIAESLVRWLYLLARWTQAMASGADSALVAYREHMATEQIHPGCESCRPGEA
jgi:hypothetical protein